MTSTVSDELLNSAHSPSSIPFQHSLFLPVGLSLRTSLDLGLSALMF